MKMWITRALTVLHRQFKIPHTSERISNWEETNETTLSELDLNDHVKVYGFLRFVVKDKKGLDEVLAKLFPPPPPPPKKPFWERCIIPVLPLLVAVVSLLIAVINCSH